MLVQAPLRLEATPVFFWRPDALQLMVAMWASSDRFWVLGCLRGWRVETVVVLGRVGAGRVVVGAGDVVVGVVATGAAVVAEGV